MAAGSVHGVTVEMLASRPGGSCVDTVESVCVPSERATLSVSVGFAPAAVLLSAALAAGVKGTVGAQEPPEPF